jgi:hypothetical protein
LLQTSSGAAAQSAQALASSCAVAGGDATWCAVGAGAGRDLAGYAALLAGPGSALPAQPSTLGMRIGGAPRFGASLRAAAVSVVVPSTEVLDLEDSNLVPATEMTVELGLFEGLSVLPTVGGLFSLDVFGSASLAFLPDYFGTTLSIYSVGARIGLLRESFTLPAVTISAARRFSGDLTLGSLVPVSYRTHVRVDPGITSFRATVAKDLFAFGVLAGVGWDDVSSSTTLTVHNAGGGSTVVAADVEASRRTYFAGLAKQLGVLSWMSLEVGWVQGFDPVAGGVGASPDPGRQIYGSLALVLRL